MGLLYLYIYINIYIYILIYLCISRSQWPRGLRRRSRAARLLRSWVRIPPGAWMSVCCECCVLSGRGPCDELITRPEESYRLWSRNYKQSSWMRRPRPIRGLSRQQKKIPMMDFALLPASAISKVTPVVWVEWTDSVERQVTGSCEHVHEP